MTSINACAKKCHQVGFLELCLVNLLSEDVIGHILGIFTAYPCNQNDPPGYEDMQVQSNGMYTVTKWGGVNYALN